MPAMSPIFRIARRLLLATTLAGLALPALPQTPARYTVEVVVFRQGGQAGAEVGAGAVPAGGDDVEPMIVASRRLGGAASRLRGASGYRVLGQAAWVQGPTAWNSRRGVAAARLGMAGAGVQGKFILERGQYLHLGIDLLVEDGGRRYRINEVRRVKVDEVQYFDHPGVGVIAVVSAGT